MRVQITLFSLLVCSFIIIAQESNNKGASIEDLVEEVLLQLSEEDEDEIDYSVYYEELLGLAQNPIDLNETTQEELKNLFFLSELQVENILFYIYQYGKMHTIYELRLIEGLDEKTIRFLLPFVRVGKGGKKMEAFSLKNSLKYGKNSLFFLLKSGIEKPKGYKTLVEGKENTVKDLYLGNRFYNSFRYRFQHKNRLLFGFTAEKDAGEIFFKEKKAYDFLSGYVQLNNIGGFKNINLGDFRANFGEGLVFRTNMMMGKSTQVLNRSQMKPGLQRYSSTDEYNFFRGLGATYKLGKFDISAFYSNKMIDADTIGGKITSIYKTGLHRTNTELRKRQTVNQQVLGANISITQHHYQLGVTFAHTALDHSIEPKANAYNAHAFRGRKQTTAGIHYRTRWNKINAFGETAITTNSALATMNGISFNPISTLGFLAIHRYLSENYNSFYARSFTVTTQCKNEHGFYLGIEIYPIRKWKISTYVDTYRFPWLKHNTAAPSIGSDYLLNIEYEFNRNLDMYWRFNCKEKAINHRLLDERTMQLREYKRANFRYGLRYGYGGFRFQTIINGNVVKKADSGSTFGVSALQDLSYSFSSIPMRMDLRYQFFDAKDYENRIFSYEKDVLYAFSIPMAYGVGSRYYINIKYDITENFNLWLKISQTAYADNRKTTGSGKEEIDGNRKTNINLLARWNFQYAKKRY